MKIQCPNCDRENEADEAVSGMVKCTGCERWFENSINILHQPADPEMLRRQDTARRVEKIRRQAEGFSWLAVGCFALGLIIVVASILCGGSFGAIVSGASVWGVAFWLYAVAQIIYIRANTER